MTNLYIWGFDEITFGKTNAIYCCVVCTTDFLSIISSKIENIVCDPREKILSKNICNNYNYALLGDSVFFLIM